jgi:hypothetical protein
MAFALRARAISAVESEAAKAVAVSVLLGVEHKCSKMLLLQMRTKGLPGAQSNCGARQSPASCHPWSRVGGEVPLLDPALPVGSASRNH